jgi:hypothetical protein
VVINLSPGATNQKKAATMEYQAKLHDSKSFELMQGDLLIGKLTYQSWYKFDASAVLANGSTYQIVQKGFWGTTIEVKDNEKVLANFSMHWNGEIVIQLILQTLKQVMY